MEFMLVRRISDKQYLSRNGFHFTSQLTLAEMFTIEEIAQVIAETATRQGHPSEVVYVTCSISNVKG